MGSGWSSETSSECSEGSSEPYQHLVTTDEGSVVSNAKYNAAAAFSRSSPSLLEQPKPYIGADTTQESTEDLPSTTNGVARGSCAWSIDLTDWAGKRKKTKGENRPKLKAAAGRPPLAAARVSSSTEASGRVDGTPPLLPVVVLQDDRDVGKLATSPEDLSTRKCFDLMRW